MAGKRQHFVPRFLQEGFASHGNSDATFVWVYRKGAAPFTANVNNVGVEGQFYTSADDTEADDIITDLEGPFSLLVRSLRMSAPAVVSDPQIPRFIAHLEVRSRHLRQNILQTGDYLFSRLLDFMSDERLFLPLLEKRVLNDPKVRETMTRKIKEWGFPPTALDLIMEQARIEILRPQMKVMVPAFNAALRSQLPNKLKDIAKSSHIRALKKFPAPEARAQRYERLVYSVVEAADCPLILGDSMMVFLVNGPRPYNAFLDADDIVSGVILPLSSATALVGATERSNVLPAKVREALARCSLEYFIAGDNSEANNLLQEQIGQDAALLTTEEMERVVSEWVKELPSENG